MPEVSLGSHAMLCSLSICKRSARKHDPEALEAYKRVKAKDRAAGVDEQSIADFERDLKANLYKIWNRMSSGSYLPPLVAYSR